MGRERVWQDTRGKKRGGRKEVNEEQNWGRCFKREKRIHPRTQEALRGGFGVGRLVMIEGMVEKASLIMGRTGGRTQKRGARQGKVERTNTRKKKG